MSRGIAGSCRLCSVSLDTFLSLCTSALDFSAELALCGHCCAQAWATNSRRGWNSLLHGARSIHDGVGAVCASPASSCTCLRAGISQVDSGDLGARTICSDATTARLRVWRGLDHCGVVLACRVQLLWVFLCVSSLQCTQRAQKNTVSANE